MPIYEPSHEIMVFFILRKLILQMHMRSHPVGLDVWFLVWPFVYSHTLCVRTAKALVRLRGCASSPSLVTYVISGIISWAGSYCNFVFSNIWYSWHYPFVLDITIYRLECYNRPLICILFFCLFAIISKYILSENFCMPMDFSLTVFWIICKSFGEKNNKTNKQTKHTLFFTS